MSLLSFLPILIISVGIYFLINSRIFFILRPKRTLKFAFSGESTRKRIFSLMLALAGTLGVGNIVGVSVGIAIGGAGSVFWLIFSALFSSVIKYAEVYLSSSRASSYGMIGVIKESFGGMGKALSKIYALLALILAFFMGCIFQADAISDSMPLVNGKKPLIPLILIALFTALISILGKDRIKGAVSVIIPFAAAVYTGMCLFVILNELRELPRVIGEIFSAAFNIRSASGGMIGFITASGMKEGFARGLLSNEAGAGTSSFSHTSHLDTSAPTEYDSDSACRAGIFGILEVVFDTLFLCPLTAFAVLLGRKSSDFSGDIRELSGIFDTYVGSHAELLLALSILAFAVSTVFCWYYYGKVSLEYLIGKRFRALYPFIFFAVFTLGLIFDIPHALFVTDTTLFFLSLISLTTILKNRKKIKYHI